MVSAWWSPRGNALATVAGSTGERGGVMKDGKPEPLWYEYRPNKGYFYGPGAPVHLRGKPVMFGEPITPPKAPSDGE
jgi:hypothetical protein